MSGQYRRRMENIVDAADTAFRFVRGRDRSGLETDLMPGYAPVRALEIIGDAASEYSAAGRRAFLDLPWIGMRNRLVHACFDVYLDVLWDTVADDIRPLAGRIKELPRD